MSPYLYFPPYSNLISLQEKRLGKSRRENVCTHIKLFIRRKKNCQHKEHDGERKKSGVIKSASIQQKMNIKIYPISPRLHTHNILMEVDGDGVEASHSQIDMCEGRMRVAHFDDVLTVRSAASK